MRGRFTATSKVRAAVRSLTGVALVTGLTLAASAAPPPAGTVISNRATATFINEALGTLETVTSNTVEAEVLPVPAIEVVGEQTLRLPRSTQGIYSFRAVNTGNVPLDVSSDPVELASDDFDVAGALFRDINGNGTIDPGEPELGETDSYRLVPGEAETLIYRFEVPASVAEGDVSMTRLDTIAKPATGPATTLTARNQSTTIIVDGALTLTKSANLREAAGEIDYVISVRNNGGSAITPYGDVGGDAILVDGAPRNAVLVRDPIPLNTHLVSAEQAGGFEPVYHRRGDAEHSYVSAPPTPRSEIDAIAFLHDGDFEAGRSSDLAFSVSVVDTVASTTIVNEAIGFLSSGSGVRSASSNEVITTIGGPGHTIEFKDGDDVITSTPFNVNLLVEVGAAGCNLTRDIDLVEVTIMTQFSGDVEKLTARETGANTGIFRTPPIAVFRADSATPGNGVLEGSPGDAAGAVASASCLGETLTKTLEVQPGGFVFDSITNEPVSGAHVFAYIAGAVGADREPVSETTTGGDGYFDLGAIPAGDYELEVFPPVQFSYPSVRSDFTGFGRIVDNQISYGIAFSFGGGAISGIDIPLDPQSALPLTLTKTADRTESRRGGYVVFTLEVRNTLPQALLQATIEDVLPAGFLYVEGSVRMNGEPLAADAEIGDGRLLRFGLGTLAPASEAEITYAVRIATGAGQGRKTNTALLRGLQAGTGTEFTSGIASSTVEIDDRGGVFADEGVVIGRVFLDRDGDGVQRSENEPGVPGVKIVTSTGLAVVTDAEGRYSLFGLRPVSQVFAIVRETLPSGTQPTMLDTDDMGVPGSRMIDMKRGELRAEDFPLEWSPEAETDVAERRDRYREAADALPELGDDLPLPFDSERRLSSRNEAALDTKAELLTRSEDRTAPAAAEPDKAPLPVEEAIAGVTPELGFVGAEDGMQAGGSSLTLRVKSRAEAVLQLEVNGSQVPDSRIGAKAIDSAGGVQLYEYVALRLRPDDNTITAIVSDPFGNERERASITVYAPGPQARLEIDAPDEAPANARLPIPITVRVTDAKGRRVKAPAEVTLTAQDGVWDAEDIRPAIPGVQVYLDDGEATFDFIPPDLVGGEKIEAIANFATAKAEIGIVPDLSERILVGLVEGAVTLDRDGDGIDGVIERDGLNAFEETTEGVRGQLYLKGKIRGDALLTLRYDSDRSDDERLFRDIRRDEFYPVYGDTSERGFDAQSNSALYVKIEREQSYLLYGDIAVEPHTDAIRLGAYRRSLTGARAHYEHGPVTIDLFAAETDQDQRVIEIRGRGVSGPYDVELNGIVEGSEIVELIVRDRDQPDVIISTQQQQRLTDYSLDFFSGAILFNRPVPQIDADLNPVSIRVTYETEDGAGDEYFVYGGEARLEPVEGVAIGYREVRSDADRDSDERRTVRTGYVELEREGWGSIVIELAQTRDNVDATGEGARAAYEFRSDSTTLRAEAALTEEEFDAPNSSVRPGREEVRLTAEQIVSERLIAGTDVLYSRARESGERRAGIELRARYAVTPNLDLVGGSRAVTTDRDTGDSQVLSAIAGVAWRPSVLPGATLRAEYEQDFADGDHWRLLAGGDYQWSPSLRLYALNEISTAETGHFGLGDGSDAEFTTKIGAEYRVSEAVNGFSEYRDGGTLSADGGVASGLRGKWRVSEVLSLRASAEHVEPVGAEDERSSSGTLGAAYENPASGLLLRGDLEGERAKRGWGAYTNLAASYRLDRDLTVLARNRTAYEDRDDEERLRDRLRLGLAWRPEYDSRFKTLALYEFEYDDDGDRTEQAHRWSVGGTFSPSADLRTNLRYSGERFSLDFRDVSDAATLHLLRAGAEIDFANDRLALAGNAVLFTDDNGDSVTAGAGAELKVNVAGNAQIGIGYNHIDVDENRLRDLYEAGLYLRLRLKLEDSLWDAFDQTGLTGE